MNDAYHTLFKQLPSVTAPASLKADIFARIHVEERRAAIRNTVIATPVIAVSFVGMVWGGLAAGSALVQSGFVEYVALLFSDTSTIVSLWYPFALTLLETLPLFALTILVGALLAFTTSTVVAARSAKRAFSFA